MQTVSVKYYFYILKLLEGLQLSRETLKDIVPFHLAGDTSLNTRVSIDEFNILLSRAGEILGDKHIGMHTSQQFRISNYGHAGGIFSVAETVEQAIGLSIKYACLAHTVGEFRPSSLALMDTKLSTYIWTPNFEPHLLEQYKQITECIISNYVATINWLSWSVGKSVKKVSFQHSATQPVTEYKAVLNCDVEFDAARTEIYLDKQVIKTPLSTSNPVKLSLMNTKLSLILANYNKESNIVERVKYALHRIILHSQPSLALVAQDLYLSERTLKRYLHDHNCSFRQIVQSVKMDLCDSYMKEGLSYSEIAQLLWYHDQSAFTRAFKDWHGASPTKLKARAGQ